MQALAEKIKPVILNIKSDYNLPSLGIAVFTLYAITQRLLDLYSNIRVFDVTVIRVFELLLISFSLLCLLIGRYDQQKFVKSFTGIDILWFVAIIYIFINLFRIEADRYDYFIFAAVLFFLFFAKTEADNFRTAFLLIKCGAIFYAAGTLVQFIIPEQFNNFILSLTSKYSRETLDYRVRLNYYPGFGYNQIGLAANYISLGMGSILVYWSDNKVRIRNDIILFIVLLAALFITGKRSFLLWTIVALYLTYIATGLGSDRLRRIIKASVLVFFSTVLAFAIVQFFGDMPLFARLQLLFREVLYQDVTGSVAARFRLFQEAWNFFLSSPWFGIGWDQFFLVNKTGYRVHNLFLQVLAETGIVGFVLIIPPIIYSYVATYKALRSSFDRINLINPLWSKALALSFYYQTVFLLNNISDTLFYRPPFLLVYFLTLAIVNSYIYLQRNFEPGQG